MTDELVEVAYPLDADESDPRFTLVLVLHVADVLQEHGYPELGSSGRDHVELQQALFRFLYVRR